MLRAPYFGENREEILGEDYDIYSEEDDESENNINFDVCFESEDEIERQNDVNIFMRGRV